MTNIEKNFIAFIENFKGEKDVLLVTLDVYGLRWLAEELIALAKGRRGSLVMGNGEPVCSDGQCLLIVSANESPVGTSSAFGRKKRFSLTIDSGSINDIAELIIPLLENEPAHQYLEPYTGCNIVISTGEYTAADLRYMRRKIDGL